MKIRNGFVSNSSSSSFIIGIAKIADEKRLKQILKKVPKEDKADYMVGTFEEIAQSPIVGRLYRLTTNFDSKTKKCNTKDRLNKIVIEAPVNTCETVSIEADGWNQNELVKYIRDENGDVWAKSSKKPALWFAICSGNDEGDGGNSPFYKYTKWQQFLSYCIIPINWMSRNLLYPIIKVLNKIFKKNWFYPYLYITPKSGYDKVKNHKFFKKEWQREIVKAFEETETGRDRRYPNEGIFSDEYGCYTYKIGAERNG